MCYESDSVEDAAWNEVPEHCLKLYWWQGPPHKNKVKQYEIVVSFKVSLFIHVLYRHENKRVYFVCWKKSVSEDPSLLIKMYLTAHL